jgi:hypothetical protein
VGTKIIIRLTKPDSVGAARVLKIKRASDCSKVTEVVPVSRRDAFSHRLSP